MFELAILSAEFEAKFRPVKKYKPLIILQPHQTPKTNKLAKLFMAGRGAGKTLFAATKLEEYLQKYGEKAWATILAPTISDARLTCLEGVTGLFTLYGENYIEYNKTNLTLIHKSGGRVRAFGSESPGRLRGPQHGFLWVDESAICDDEAIDNALMGLRIGDDPVVFYTTTPRPTKRMKDLVKDPDVELMTATTYDNRFLPKSSLKRFETLYGGTTLGQQELQGQLIEELEGALWKRAWIDAKRLPADTKIEFQVVVVAIDPAVTSGDQSAETGITVAGLGMDGDYYVMNNNGLKVSPLAWAKYALDWYTTYEADRLIGEVNNGGDLVESNIRSVDRDVSYRSVHATRGKVIRAEPVAALYEQGRVHHVGIFPHLEDQMAQFPIAGTLVDRLDSLVWAIHYLMKKNRGNFSSTDETAEDKTPQKKSSSPFSGE